MQKVYFLPACFLIYTVLGFLDPQTASARWADPKDASYVVLSDKYDLKIKKDGSYTQTTTSVTEILKDSARADKGILRLTYEEKVGDVKVLEAYTDNNGKITRVNPKEIETKQLASSGSGFAAKIQITVAFQNVNVGSKLYLKARRRMLRPQFANNFMEIYTIGANEYVKNFEVSYDSEIPLFYEVNDPDHVLDIQRSGKKLIFKNTKPIYRAILEEDSSFYDTKSILWIGVSSIKSWSDFSKKVVRRYDEVFSSPLPGMYKDILELAQKKKTDVEQMNEVTSHIADQIRYIADWRAIDGGYLPRSLKTITQSGYGDCKDYTVSTGAILKRLGFEVYAAWVIRGDNEVLSPLELPVPEFNHALLFAKKDGKEYWIDPTNTVSFAQGLFSDIEDRNAVVLFPEGAKRMRIPALTADGSETRVNLDLDFSSRDLIQGKGSLELRGQAVLGMTASELSNTKEGLDYNLVTWATKKTNLLSWKFDNYNLQSRVAEDFVTHFTFQEPWLPIMTSMGEGYTISTLEVARYFQIATNQRIASLRFAYPGNYTFQYQIHGRDVFMNKDIECKGTSAWGDYSRSFLKKSGQIFLKDNFKLKTRTILPQEIATNEFKDFQQKMIACLQPATVIFK